MFIKRSALTFLSTLTLSFLFIIQSSSAQDESSFDLSTISLDVNQIHDDQLIKQKEIIDLLKEQIEIIRKVENLDEGSLATIKTSINAIQGFLPLINVQLENYKTLLDNSLLTDLSSIKTSFQGLVSELEKRKVLIEDLKNAEADEIAQKLIEQLSTEITKIQDLTRELQSAKDLNTENEITIKSLNEQKDELDKTNSQLTVELAKKNGELYYFTRKNFRLGMSFGFNFNSIEYQYLVSNDSTVSENKLSGPSGIASAVMIIQPDTLVKGKQNHFQLILNVPLVEIGLGGDNSAVSSIFNRQVSLGIGIGYQFHKSPVSIAGIVNLKRIKRIDEKSFKVRNDGKLFYQDPFSKLDLDELATINEANTTITLAVIMKFGQ